MINTFAQINRCASMALYNTPTNNKSLDTKLPKLDNYWAKIQGEIRKQGIGLMSGEIMACTTYYDLLKLIYDKCKNNSSITFDENVSIEVAFRNRVHPELTIYTNDTFDSVFFRCINGSLWKLYEEPTSCAVIPQEGIKLSFRNGFNISTNEEIYFGRDTSFWNSGNQGLVITDKALHVIPDNDDLTSSFTVEWSEIEKVTYKEFTLYFWNGRTSEPMTIIHIDYFVKDAHNKEGEIGRFLATLFTNLAQLSVNPITLIDDEYNRIYNQEGEDSALEFALKTVKSTPDAAFLYINIVQYYSIKEDWNNVLYFCNEGICKVEVDSWVEIRLRDLRSDAYLQLGNYENARRDYLNTYLKASDDMTWGEEKASDMAVSSFHEANALMSKHILDKPYKDRKVVMTVSTYCNLDAAKSISILGVDVDSPIKYPIGHPIENQLYVGHPYIVDKYMPFETYQLELVEDKIREFCTLAQCLGAIEISIDCLNTSNTNINQQQNIHANSSVGSFVYAAETEGQYNSNIKNRMIDELSRAISLHQTYAPHQTPYLPEGMVWYDNEPSWQRLYAQRVNGGLLSHEERIETKKSQMIDNKELANIQSEVNSIYLGLNLDFTKEEKLKFTQQENAVISIKVKFASLNEIQNNNSRNMSLVSNCPAQISSEEQEYINELKEILSYGEISSRERRLLEKIRIGLGISAERAQELETSLTPSLSEEEQEYLDEYKEIIREGILSDRDKRFLEKLKKANGISEERAKELESLV